MAADLAQFCDRLKESRRHLATRIADADDGTRKFPDTGFLRIFATLQTSIEAIEEILAEDKKGGADAA